MEESTPARCLDKSEVLRRILSGLGPEPSGPIYISTHKHLAKTLMASGEEQDAIYHLSESHGATLRNKMQTHLKRKFKDPSANVPTLSGMLDRIKFDGSFHSGYHGLQQRLVELPKEWVVVQLTMEWDSLSRFPCRNRNVNRGLGMHITRFACGSYVEGKSQHRQSEQPMTIFLPAFDDGEDRLTFMAAIRNHLSIFESDREDRRRAHNECSMSIEATVNEMQMWLGGWLCLLMGRLVSEKLEHALKTAIDSFILSYCGDSKKKECDKEVISDKAFNILYLLASSPSISSSEVQKVVCSLFKDQKFASYMSKKVCDVKSKFCTPLLRGDERHPVILLVDEELDILPFEVISPLQDQSFTRMPSIHFLHSLYLCHKDSVIKKGVNIENCYYVINPSKNLPNLEKLFETISTIPSVKNWKGVLNTEPSTDQFLNGLQNNDLFVYCGHGGGNQYLTKSVDMSPNKATAFLFGCSSSSLTHLGGRVEMSSLSYSYLISGSPCVVGMLWQVLDTDVNAMTEELLKSWCNSGRNGQKIPDIDSLERDLKNVNLNSTQCGKTTRDLGRAVCLARKTASRFLNRAALVVRGLPLKAM